jgi:hypothetical protein
MRYRNYLIRFTLESGESIEVKPPFNIAFSVFKATSQGLNQGAFQLYNLSENVRTKLVKTLWQSDKKITIDFYCGFDIEIGQIYKGNITRSFIQRRGSDIVLVIDSISIGSVLETKWLSQSIDGSKNLAVKKIASELEVNIDVFTKQADLTRPKVLWGDPLYVLNGVLQYGDEWVIDNGSWSVFNMEKETISDVAVVINAETGLINTPDINGALGLEFETLMNPFIQLGGLIDMQSLYNKSVNGIGRVVSIEYRGEYEGAAWSQVVKAVRGREFGKPE